MVDKSNCHELFFFLINYEPSRAPRRAKQLKVPWRSRFLDELTHINSIFMVACRTILSSEREIRFSFIDRLSMTRSLVVCKTRSKNVIISFSYFRDSFRDWMKSIKRLRHIRSVGCSFIKSRQRKLNLKLRNQESQRARLKPSLSLNELLRLLSLDNFQFHSKAYTCRYPNVERNSIETLSP